jgi:hypothetical protein
MGNHAACFSRILDLDFLFSKGHNMAVELSFFEKAMGWRKRQMVEAQIDQNEVTERIRNLVLEEVAKEIEKMKVFGPDTISGFTIVIRNMKRELY